MANKSIIKLILGEDEDDDILKDVLSNEPKKRDPYDVWWDTYRPIMNPLFKNPEEAPFNGAMFETFGQELDYVRNANKKHVWTYMSGDNGEDLIVAGFHFVNRLGYFITEKPWNDESEYFEIGGPDEEEEAENKE